MKVPLLDLQAQLAPLKDEITAVIAETVDSCRYILGPEVAGLEKEVASYSGTDVGIGVSSGTDALLVGLMALEIGPGDLVLTTPYSFFATMGSILRLGAEPVFADIDPLTYNIDPDQVASILEQPQMAGRIKAIIPVHLFGQCADMDPLMSLAAAHDIPVLEDAAQAIGAVYPGRSGDGALQWRRAGSMGDAGCFSFFPSKNLGCMGDGGMIVTSRFDLAQELPILRTHGGSPKYYHAVLGGNFRLDAIQAAILRVKLRYLPSWHAARRQNAATYVDLFADRGLVETGRVELPYIAYGEAAGEDQDIDCHIFNQFVIRARDRDGLKDFLLAEGIGVEVYYPVPLHQQKCVSHLAIAEQSFPETERAAAETLALPIYPELTSEMQAYVVDRIAAFYA